MAWETWDGFWTIDEGRDESPGEDGGSKRDYDFGNRGKLQKVIFFLLNRPNSLKKVGIQKDKTTPGIT